MAECKEQKWFEAWYKRVFKGQDVLLKKDKDGAYEDEIVSAMFIGFAGGWNCK